MKSLTCSIAFAALFASVTAQAVPMQYSFSGEIIDIEVGDNVTGLTFPTSAVFAGTTFTIGDSISYEFLVDFSKPGQCSDPGGFSSVDCNDPAGISEPPGATFDYFYTELLHASVSTSLTWLDISLNYGLSQNTFIGGEIFGESAISLSSVSRVEDWTVGTLLAGFDRWETVDAYGLVTSEMTLTSIKPIPVPEPSTLFLLAAGLFLFCRPKRLFQLIPNGCKPEKTPSLL